MKSTGNKIALIVFATLLAACASTVFYPYESRNNVIEGKGGTRFVNDGIDVWFNGEPPHRYAILGYIEDHRTVGVDESHKTVSSDVLKKAREVGADGLIEVVTQSITNSSVATGTIFGGRGFGFGMGIGMPVTAEISVKYTAVKYLD